MKKPYIYLVITIILAWLLGGAAYSFMDSHVFQIYLEWTKQNLILFVITLILIKSISSAVPPIPSLVLTLTAIPTTGWFGAYLIDFIGSIIGSALSYYIAYYYGLPVVSKIFDANTLKKVETIKIKKGREIESVVVLRIITAPTLVEAINYGAGLLKMPFKKYFTGLLISHPLIGIPTFLLANNLVNQENTLFSVAILIVSILGIYLVRNRYFETLKV